MPDYPRIIREVSQPATIGELQVDAILERTANLDSDVTEFPVEDGFPISDHVERKPITLSMTVICTPTPVQFLKPSATRMNEVVSALFEIYKAAEPITVTTHDAIYENMIMTHAPLPRNVSDGYCYKMQIDFVQVRKAGQRTEAIPTDEVSGEAQGSAGATEKDTGSASQTDIGTGIKLVESDAGTYSTDLFTVDTDSAGKATAGAIETKKEQTAHAAAIAIIESLVAVTWRK